jgi:hypothetical protein
MGAGSLRFHKFQAQWRTRAQAALRVLAERLEHRETSLLIEQVFSVAAA